MTDAPVAAMTPAPAAPPPQRRRRRWLWVLLFTGLPLLLAGGLLGTETALKSILYYGLRKMPLLTIAQVEGSLLHGFNLLQLRYVSEYEDIQIGSVQLKISPSCLLRQKLCVDTLAIRDVDWHILQTRPSEEFDFPAINLPPILLPFNIDVAEASLNRMTLYSPHSHFDIRDAVIRAHTDNNTVFLNDVHTELVFTGLTIRAALQGNIDLRGDTAASLTTQVGLDFSADVPDLEIEGDINGPAYTPALSVTTHGLVEAHTELSASFREKGWPVYARVRQNAPIVLGKQVPISLGESVAIISGYVNAYHVEGQTQVSGVPETPPVTVGIITDGGFLGVRNANATLNINQQQAKLAGEFTWYPKLYWNTSVEFEKIDMATWLEGATSDLSGSAQVEGEWYPRIPFRNNVKALDVKGHWREFPVTMQAGIETTADTLSVDHLQTSLGTNNARLHGSVANDWQFSGDFVLPQLAMVLPQLAGAITGKLAVSGPRNSPHVDISASSPHLQVFETVLENSRVHIDGEPGQHRAEATTQWQGYTASTALNGDYEKNLWQAQLSALQVSRDNKTYTLKTPSKLRYALESKKIELDTLCLQSAGEELCASTRWHLTHPQGEIKTRLQNADPLFLTPFLSWLDGKPGRWSGTAEATFAGSRPDTARWNLSADDLQLKRLFDKRFKKSIIAPHVSIEGELQHQELSAKASIRWPDQQTTRASLRLPEIVKPDNMELTLDSAPLPLEWITPWVQGVSLTTGKVAAKLSGKVVNGWPTLDGNITVQNGKLHALQNTYGLENIDATLLLAGKTATLSGGFQDDRDMDWQLSTPVIVHWSKKSRQFSLKQGCLSASINSSLCALGHYSLDNGIDLGAEISGNISPWLAPVLNDNALIDGPFKGSVRLRQVGDQLTGDAQVRSTLSSTLVAEDGTSPPTVDASLDAHLANHRLAMEFGLRSSVDGTVEGKLQAEISGSKSLEGHVDVHNVNIQPLAPFIRELEHLSGQVNGDFLISGTLPEPTLEGNLRLADGKLSSAIYPVSFNNINANAVFTQQRAALNASLESGKRGRATLNSEARWTGGAVKTTSRLVGKDLPVKQGSDINLKLDTDLTLASSDGRMDLGGLVHVKEGFLRVAKLPENSTNVSKDVVYVDERGEQEKDTGIDTHLNLAVRVSDLVQLDGLGAQVRLSGAVGIQQTPPNDPTGRGSFTISEGTYTGYGQKLKITKGQILFNGALDNPVLAITAVREVGTVVAGINISGTPQLPEATLFSVPAKPEEDILTYILTGHAPDESGADNRYAINQALVSVGLYGSEGFARDLASKAGIEDFEISTGGNTQDESSVNVGGYLSPKLYVQYGVGINTTVNTLTLRYRLTQSIFLEALSGMESALDVLYSFEVE